MALDDRTRLLLHRVDAVDEGDRHPGGGDVQQVFLALRRGQAILGIDALEARLDRHRFDRRGGRFAYSTTERNGREWDIHVATPGGTRKQVLAAGGTGFVFWDHRVAAMLAALERAHELWVWTDVDISKLAEVFGAQGLRVEKPAQFAPALEKAIASKRSTIIDVVTDLNAEAPLAVS